MTRFLITLLLAVSLPAAAQILEPLPPPPPPPEGVEGDPVEPEVTILQRGGDEVQEYRVNGRLYMVKVTPPHGVPYYLVDLKGDGVMIRRDQRPELSVPMWVIKSW
ncbi:MAG: DUF2782 domain-containing protein [Zoogloeaceae bacterium]|nr:DUF2782 domain-containing protein [Zoogloeaceae bacterium]